MMRKFFLPLNSLLCTILTGCVVFGSFYWGLFSGFENFLEDRLYTQKPPPTDLVILAIDNESLKKIGQWPWSRETFARAIKKLNNYEPQSVGIDVIFAEPSSRGHADDETLTEALQNAHYPIILAAESPFLVLERDAMPQSSTFIKPLPVFEKSPKVTLGHVNLILDRDGVARKFARTITTKEQSVNALAYEVILRAGKIISKKNNPEPTERIVYSAAPGTIQRIPLARLLEEDIEEMVKGKIILVGSTAADLHDEKSTPLSRGSQMPGVEIQANIVAMLLRADFLLPLTNAQSFFWIIGAAVLSVIPFFVFPASFALPLIINFIFGLFHIAAAIILFELGYAANIIHLNLAWICSSVALAGLRYFKSEGERKKLKKIFSKYVSKDVLEHILKNPSAVKLGGEEKEVTVFFSDIRGFTTLSEKTSPTELVKILNTYFTEMSEEILTQGGVLDKYIGDAIMAFWGAPLEDPKQAEHALEASLAMLKKLGPLNKKIEAMGGTPINIGIGLYTGPVVVGNIGSESRFDYTIIGDTVNVASRLEGLNKEYKTNIILGETTKNKLINQAPLVFLGSVKVKGRDETLSIYTLNVF